MRSAGQARARLLAGAWVVAVLALTLPATTDPGRTIEGLCILCGDRGLADAILNFLLFLPGGYLVARATGRMRWGILTGLLLSALAESLQISIAGRHPSLGDLVTNTAGAGVGAFLLGRMPWRPPVRRSDPRRWAAFALPIAAVGTAVLVGTPITSEEPYYGLWTPGFTGVPAYPGEVVEGRLGDLVAGPLRRIPPATVEGVVAGDVPVVLVVRAAPLPPSIPSGKGTSVFSLRDGRSREILGVHAARLGTGEGHREVGLTLHTLRIADAIRLGSPETLVPFDVPGGEGEEWSLRLHLEGRSVCVSTGKGGEPDPGSVGTEVCGLGIGLADLWRYLFEPGAGRKLLTLGGTVLWIFALFGPVGWAALRLGELLLAGAFVLVSVEIVAVGALMPASEPWQTVLSAVAVVAGFLSRRRLAGSRAPAS